MTQKAITIKDLAEKLNISVSTVSRKIILRSANKPVKPCRPWPKNWATNPIP